MSENNYTLGRGEIFLALLDPITRTPGGERYIGNTPQLNLNIDATNLDHFSSDYGVKEKDESVTTQINRMANVITDKISPENLALFFFGNKSVVVSAPETGVTSTLLKVEPGFFYQLGTSLARPQGARNLATVVVKSAGVTPTTFVEGVDYLVDLVRGRIQVVKGGAIPAASDLTVTFNILASSRNRIISGAKPIEAQMRYLAHNPEGEDFDYFFPYVKVRPNGDYALKAEEWQQIPLQVEIMKAGAQEAIYIDGQPFAV